MADFNGTLVDVSAPINGIFTSVYNGTPVNLPPPALYAQRVWSTGTSVWCYYVGTINATPTSTTTTPNWVGSATQYQLLGPA